MKTAAKIDPFITPYLAAYSAGSDCNPSVHSTVTFSSLVSKIEIVAPGLTAGSTRAFRTWVRYCDCSLGLFSRITIKAQRINIASEVAPAQKRRGIVHHLVVVAGVLPAAGSAASTAAIRSRS